MVAVAGSRSAADWARWQFDSVRQVSLEDEAEGALVRARSKLLVQGGAELRVELARLGDQVGES